MATRKTARPVKAARSKGAALAAKYRSRANALTDRERQDHRAHAMRLICGTAAHAPAVHARSG